MTFLRKSLLVVGFAIGLIPSLSPANAADDITVAFTTPAEDQDFAVDANLGYSGTVVWAANTPYLDKVLIDYVWTSDPLVAPAPGSGVVVTTEQAELVNYALNIPNQLNSGGSSGFDNPPAPPNPVLKATQYSMMGVKQTKTYCLRAVPHKGAGGAYNAHGRNPYFVARRLGDVE